MVDVSNYSKHMKNMTSFEYIQIIYEQNIKKKSFNRICDLNFLTDLLKSGQTCHFWKNRVTAMISTLGSGVV